MAAIDEGTETRTALEISDDLAALGASMGASAALDSCHLRLSGLSNSWTEGLSMLAQVVRQPSFPDEEIERLKREQVARIGRELVTPVQLALRVLPVLLYGEGHPYAMPFTGSGSIAEVEATGRDHLVGFHDQWIRPQRSALLCLGDLDRDETLREVERLLGDWEAASDPSRDDTSATAGDQVRVFLLDRPGAIQSVVIGGQVVPPRNDPSELALEAFHLALGGTFTSRLNMNLREDKGWTYGASSLLWGARAERPFLLYSSVQTDATAKALLEMDRELRGLLGDRPITDQELDKAQRQLTRSLPGRWETLADIAGELEDLLSFELRPDYYDDYTQRVEALAPHEITATAASWISPDRFAWVIVGDLAEVRSEIEELGIGSVVQIDDAGQPIR
jgi:zinc protease